jgi:transcription elongation GreA/GreB family factor
VYFCTMKPFKKKLVEKCLEEQTKVVSILQNEINDAQQQSNDYGQARDRYDAYKTKLMRQIELFSKQLAQANLVLTTLQRIPSDKQNDKVEFGAIVTTNKQKLFVSAGLGKIELDGEEYFAISPNVPIFNALKGKKKGDSITFNGMEFVIVSVK